MSGLKPSDVMGDAGDTGLNALMIVVNVLTRPTILHLCRIVQIPQDATAFLADPPAQRVEQVEEGVVAEKLCHRVSKLHKKAN